MGHEERRDRAPSSADARERVRTRLVEERRRARRRLEALESERRDLIEASEIAPPDDEHDPEGATVAFERQQLAALLAEAVHRLEELDAAERRLDDATYGRCERCGAEIGAERLLALPTARRCVTCASVRQR